jgi:hypothetical protein
MTFQASGGQTMVTELQPNADASMTTLRGALDRLALHRI